MTEAPDAEDLLPQTYTALEVAFAEASRRFTAIPTPINEVKTPSLAPASFLPFLAYEVSTDLWHETWSDVTKRAAIAGTLSVKKKLGTLGAIRDYVAIEGGRVVDAVQPPAAAYAGRVLGPSDYTAWLGRLPQIRVYFGAEQGQRQSEAFCGRSFAGSAFARVDKGRALLGRHARYFSPATGLETPLTTTDLPNDGASVSETASVQGKAGATDAYAGRAFCTRSFAANPSRDAPQIISWTISSSDSTTDALTLTLGPSLNPTNTRTERVPVTAPIDNKAFCGRAFAGHAFARGGAAEINFYDRLYLADPTVPAPVTRGTSFCNHARLGIRSYTADILVDAQEKARPRASFVGACFAGRCYARRQDDSKRADIVRAITLAQSGRDRVYVDFEATRPLTFGDAPALDGSHTFSDRLKRARL